MVFRLVGTLTSCTLHCPLTLFSPSLTTHPKECVESSSTSFGPLEFDSVVQWYGPNQHLHFTIPKDPFSICMLHDCCTDYGDATSLGELVREAALDPTC